MDHTKKELENAIITIASSIGLAINFEKLIVSGLGVGTALESIVYKMFLNKFDSRSCTIEQYNAYKIILEYATEMDKNGFVNFK